MKKRKRRRRRKKKKRKRPRERVRSLHCRARYSHANHREAHSVGFVLYHVAVIQIPPIKIPFIKAPSMLSITSRIAYKAESFAPHVMSAYFSFSCVAVKLAVDRCPRLTPVITQCREVYSARLSGPLFLTPAIRCNDSDALDKHPSCFVRETLRH